jgi:hypothetical protein
MQRRNAISAGIASAAVIAVGAGAAFAVIPDSTNDGTIHGCYQKNEGQLRVIDKDAGDSCRPSEKPIEWSKNGGPQPRFYVREAQNGPNTTNNKLVNVSCDAGDIATGGGTRITGGGSPSASVQDLANYVALLESGTLGGQSATWRGRAVESALDGENPLGPKNWTIRVKVHCVDVTV